MRVLVLSNMYPSARKPHFGIFVHRRVLAYRRLGVEVEVVAVADPRRGALRTAWKYAQLTMKSVAASLAFKPDVIEAHYLVPTGLIAMVVGLAGRTPYVLYAHGSDVDVTLPGARRAVRGAAEVHTNSADTARRIRTRYPDVESVVVIPPGVDTTVFHPAGEEDPSLPPTIVFVGDLVYHKGVDVLLSALRNLKTAGWQCLLAGTGPCRAELISQAAQLELRDQLTWLGEVAPDEVANVFRRGHLAVVPSRRDALGQVAVEALACGIPVVVSQVGGLASIPTAACGAAVPPERPAELAQAIDRWLSSRHDPSVKSAAVERAAEYSLETTTQTAVDRLREVYGGHPGTRTRGH
jgi:glycosyltransferase involved in cell wall biosynthesis